MTIYDAGPLAAGPLCGLLIFFYSADGQGFSTNACPLRGHFWTCLSLGWKGPWSSFGVLKTRRGGEHRRGEGSETFLERKWVLRRFPEVS